MNTIEIIQESTPNQSTTYRAICGEKQALGISPGQALDELEQQLTNLETNTLIVIQRFVPDRFFYQPQYEKFQQLINRLHKNQDNQQLLSREEQQELEELTAAELAAATERSREIWANLKNQET
ncbi:MAG: hypothetical protein F6K54_16865 [Okeania sp. SIO3B5]|uniref:hypothetical protein n=1 Tax=Okeania sp. SIO3B5 TaxID=2607811 RepID=UPI00140063C6|nr:hypothetical protein [Okeania sp. SIO3B5]NEO54604.1 hypothetical protein [Okeania sp. SIO3B5]